MPADIYLGLMSGTSADGIDAVAVDFSSPTPRVLGSHSRTLPAEIRTTIHKLAMPSDNEIDLLGQLDVQMGELFAATIIELVRKNGLSIQTIAAIGSHGQTLRHRPPGSLTHPFTLQIGDPNIIADRTGITTVADFRRRDMAAGGQGAPLVPAFHKAAFQSAEVNRVIVNIGGIANITWLPISGEASGFDTGPGNVLMDAWVSRHLSRTYDEAGAWAASGTVNKELLEDLLLHPFLALLPPKSTGREDFNPAWLDMRLQQYRQLAPEDIQTTLLAFTAKTITDQIKRLSKEINTEVYLCGGGAYNDTLRHAIQALLPACPVTTTTQLGIAPEWIEATAFAWLAKQTLNRQSGNLCAVTGAKAPVILGGVYYA